MHDHPHHHEPGDSHVHVHHDSEAVRTQPVLLELGEGMGALIVHTDPELLGVEIEISPAGDDDNRQHKQVLRRMLGPVAATVLVYDNLPEGDYTLWVDETRPLRDVHVRSSQVAEVDRRHATEPALAAG
jgi:hypothetical protein